MYIIIKEKIIYYFDYITHIIKLILPQTLSNSHNHTTANITSFTSAVQATKVNAAGVADSASSVNWSGVTNKPTSLAHATNADTATYANTADVANSVTWANVSSKPSSFTPSTHNHSTAEITSFSNSQQRKQKTK